MRSVKEPTTCSVNCESTQCNTERTISCGRVHSHVSIISLDANSRCLDDDDSMTSDCGFLKPQRKRLRLLTKSVRFVDTNTCSDLKPLELVSVSNNVEYEAENVCWSCEDLSRFHGEAKMMYGYSADVRDYVDAFQKVRDHFFNFNSIHAISGFSRDEFHTFVQGLCDGWRVLECFASAQRNRERQVRKVVETIVAAQKLSNLAEIASSLTATSVAWAAAIGRAEHLVTQMDSATAASRLHRVFARF